MNADVIRLDLLDMRFSNFMLASIFVSFCGCENTSEPASGLPPVDDRLAKTDGLSDEPHLRTSRHAASYFRDPDSNKTVIAPLLHTLVSVPKPNFDTNCDIRQGGNAGWVVKNGGPAANAATLKRIFETAKIVEATDPTLQQFHLAPWFIASFSDRNDVCWDISVYLGSLAVLSNNKMKAAIYYDLQDEFADE